MAGLALPDFSMSAAPMDALSMQQPAQVPDIPIKRGGMFGGIGDNGKMAIMAAIAGLMARRHPQVSQMMQALMQQRMESQQYQQRRQQQLDDQKAMYDYKLAHPDQGDSEFERVAAAGGYTPGTQQYIDLMKRKADAMANPIVMTPYGPMLYSAVAGAAQPEIIQSLPPGAKPIGGPSSQGSGGFRFP